MATDDLPPMIWPPMIWLGGAPGAGKSTLARILAHRYDLPRHPIDAWTYAHLPRLPPPTSTFDADLEAGPALAADAFINSARTRLPLIIEDVEARNLGTVPALVEGPQLFPQWAGSLASGHGVWLVPDAELTRIAREERLAAAPDEAGRARLERLLLRDSVLADRVREEAHAAGLPVIEVPAAPDWNAVLAAVEEALSRVLQQGPRLEPGETLSNQRQFENRTVVTQLRLWQEDASLATVPSFSFSCECGRTGCDESWSGTPDDYESLGGDPLVVSAHRS